MLFVLPVRNICYVHIQYYSNLFNKKMMLELSLLQERYIPLRNDMKPSRDVVLMADAATVLIVVHAYYSYLTSYNATYLRKDSETSRSRFCDLIPEV